MGTSPTELFDAVGLRRAATVPWGTPVPVSAPGVYIISVHEDPACGDAPGPVAFSAMAIAALLEGAPKPIPATAAELEQQLALSWFDEEPIVYIGLASKSVRSRIAGFYRTPIGAPRPHAGGWFLKMLDDRHRLWVHGAATDTFGRDETRLLDAFIDGLSDASRASAVDPRLPIPFANLERAKGERKRHGISGMIRRPPRPEVR